MTLGVRLGYLEKLMTWFGLVDWNQYELGFDCRIGSELHW